jgi:hypothetical protein
VTDVGSQQNEQQRILQGHNQTTNTHLFTTTEFLARKAEAAANRARAAGQDEAGTAAEPGKLVQAFDIPAVDDRKQRLAEMRRERAQVDASSEVSVDFNGTLVLLCQICGIAFDL